jgi:hypothetical protein
VIGAVVELTSVSIGLPVPELAGLVIPAIAARLQLNEAPPVKLVGLYEKTVLLQMPGGVRVLVKTGVGFTVTTTGNGVLLSQPSALKRYTYVTLIGPLVVFTNISPGSPVPLAAALLMPVTAARLQANVVPVVRLAGVYEKRVLLQIAGGFAELLRVGLGFTANNTVKVVELGQPLAVSV